MFLQNLCEFLQEEGLPKDLAAEAQEYVVENLKVIFRKRGWFMLSKAATVVVEMIAARPVLIVKCAVGIVIIGFLAEAVLEKFNHESLGTAVGIVSFVTAGGMVGCIFGGPAGSVVGGAAGFGAWYLTKFVQDKLGTTPSEELGNSPTSALSPQSSDFEEMFSSGKLLASASPETPKSYTMNSSITFDSNRSQLPPPLPLSVQSKL